jgi:diguanylate cyclase
MALPFSKFVKRGDFIFREGDEADCAYIIETGRVQISIHKKNQDVPVVELNPGDLFGEMGIIDGLSRSASAYALEDCQLAVISKEILGQKVDASDPIIRLLISIMLKVIRQTNRAFKGEQPNNEEDRRAKKLVSQEEAHHWIKLERDLFEALEKEEFSLEYQPILNMENRELVGFEALLRWDNHKRGRVSPGDFIDVAEQSPLIVPLGEWVLNQGMKDLKMIQTELSDRDLFMSLNVSVRQIIDPLFVQRVTRAKNRQKINPSDIKLEVTERIFQNGGSILETMKKVKELGFSFTMDDFGTGYSSLTSLFTLKFETIKIDRSFVTSMLKDAKSKAIVQAVVALAGKLGLNVVAEGIEEDKEANMLMAMGCQMGQGYLFSKALPVTEIIRNYKKKKKTA